MRYIFGLFVAVVCVVNVLLADNLEIDNLLNTISAKSDLSQKTKLENGGISYIYTREDLRKMQAHNLKDVLKSTYPSGYSENYYGFPDPYSVGTPVPFTSSTIRIYIDDQEITTGLYGSGLIVYGDIDIDFVDHIEVYSGNPTFEFSSEPAFTIVKLYSKVAQKDDGNKVGVRGGSYGAFSGYGYTTRELENGWSYFTYLSQNNDKREKYYNDDATLSRDKTYTHIFGSFYNDNNKILIDGIVQSRDTFISNSLLGTPDRSDMDSDYLHIGYNGTRDGLSFVLTYDQHDADAYFTDKNTVLIQAINATYNKKIPYKTDTDFNSQTYTAGLKYKINTQKDDFLIGVKYRYKHFKFNDVFINGVKLPEDNHTSQIISTAFVENQYKIRNNQIITTGATYSRVTNNNSPQNDDLFSYRVGYTYTNEKLVSKTIISHIETTIDPYLVNSTSYLAYPDKKTPKNRQNIFMQNIKYKQGENSYEVIGSYMNSKDQLMPNYDGKLEAYSQSIIMKSFLFRYTREYNLFDKLEMTVGLNHIDNLPRIDEMMQYAATLRNFNTYKKFDIFNEILYYRDDFQNRNFFDYTAGVIYHYTADLTISLKGINLLDKARDIVYNKLSSDTLKQDSPLEIPSIDRSVMLSVEYTF